MIFFLVFVFLGKCRDSAQAFLHCLRGHDNDYRQCKEYSKAYLQCRMEENLMEPQDMSSLGFSEDKKKNNEQTTKENKGDTSIKENEIRGYDRKREKEGFISGSGVRSKIGGWLRNPFGSREDEQ